MSVCSAYRSVVKSRSRLAVAGWLVVSNVLLVGVLADSAAAAVSVSRAEVKGTELRLEGTAIASRNITVDGVVMGASSTSGTFRINRNPFTAPADCTVDVRDGSATITVARLSGCTVSTAPPPPPPPSGDTVAPTAPAGLTVTVVGTTISLSWGLSTDNIAVTGFRLTRNGTVRTTTTTAFDTTFLDTGLAAGTYTYTVAAFDAAGNTSAQSNSVSATIAGSAALSFLTPSQLPAAVIGEPYLGYIVADGGVTSYSFKLVSGEVPEEMQFTGNTLPARPEARVTGTATTVGTSTFTVEVRDGSGASARRTFTIVVTAAPPLAIPAGVNVLDAATVGVSYSGVLPVSGGGPLHSWALISGTLPPGLALGVGVVWGIPTTAGTHSFSARVTDNLGATATGQFSVTVAP